MKNLLFVLLIICFAISSCDGRDKIENSNTQFLKNYKLVDSISEDVKYFPENYNEFKIDTILSNGFRVKIKSFTDMESSYLNEFKTDNTIHKHYYRDNKATILVSNNGVIFEKLIDKKLFYNFDSTLNQFFKEAILNGVWINKEKSTLNSNITININFCKPETDWCAFFDLIIEKDGKYRIIDVTTELEKDL
ncbi:DUF4738 domain-containing protein [Lacinutrix algicola]|uniref:DUF4738 domain-containing protein n=1 Tax=Lacinutrix algicola TaxID=342954 RepID=UPI0006E2067A|nr:DUF4738 domain-containing protein [Lacinutrix algicola]